MKQKDHNESLSSDTSFIGKSILYFRDFRIRFFAFPDSGILTKQKVHYRVQMYFYVDTYVLLYFVLTIIMVLFSNPDAENKLATRKNMKSGPKLFPMHGSSTG